MARMGNGVSITGFATADGRLHECKADEKYSEADLLEIIAQAYAGVKPGTKLLIGDVLQRAQREHVSSHLDSDLNAALKIESAVEESLGELTAAVEALALLKRKHFRAMRKLDPPPDGVHLVMEALCCIFNVTLDDSVCRVDRAPSVSTEDAVTATAAVSLSDSDGDEGDLMDFWNLGKKRFLKSHTALMEEIRHFDALSIIDVTAERLRDYETCPAFRPENLDNVAAAALSRWIRARLHVYDLSRKYDSFRKVERNTFRSWDRSDSDKMRLAHAGPANSASKQRRSSRASHARTNRTY